MSRPIVRATLVVQLVLWLAIGAGFAPDAPLLTVVALAFAAAIAWTTFRPAGVLALEGQVHWMVSDPRLPRKTLGTVAGALLAGSWIAQGGVGVVAGAIVGLVVLLVAGFQLEAWRLRLSLARRDR